MTTTGSGCASAWTDLHCAARRVAGSVVGLTIVAAAVIEAPVAVAIEATLTVASEVMIVAVAEVTISVAEVTASDVRAAIA